MRPLKFATSILSAEGTLAFRRDQIRSRSLSQATEHGPKVDDDHHRSKSDSSESKINRAANYAAIFAGVGLAASLSYKRLQALSRGQVKDKQTNLVDGRDSEDETRKTTTTGKVFTRRQVAQHDSLEKGVWITYKGNVYDITEFIKHHPGGSHTIMMGAGGDVEPFWQTYTVHLASEVQRLLSTYQIGQLSPEDQQEQQAEISEGPYANDPKRNPLLQVLTEQPFNAETPAKLLTPSYITPTEIFFVRNHLPVPEVDLENYSLAVCIGSDGDPDNLQVIVEFTLDDLKTKFKPHTVESIIQCSGNRRSDLKKFKEIKGLNWQVGAIGNASWTGVRLIDLLDSLGMKLNEESFKHVQLEGLDCDMTGQSYGASISADVAFDPNKSVLLAYEMNGEPLTRDHGFPVRFVAPGVTGARNVKWLGKIILSQEESHSHWQRKDYKSFSPNVDLFSVDFDQSASIQETPVQSAICEPADGEELKFSAKEFRSEFGAKIPVKGYAYSGGGRMIIRVDVSTDGGASWMTAKLEDTPRLADGSPNFTDRNKVYSWTRWSLEVPVEEKMVKNGSVEILCRAFDSAYNSQPERPETVWNVRGVVNNSWHRIKLRVKLN